MAKRDAGKNLADAEHKEELLKKQTMSLSIKEGCFASVASGAGDSYVLPYALAIGFNNFQIGLFRSFVGLLPPVFQYFGSRLMGKWKRKRIIINFVALQAFMWFSFLGIAFLYWKNLLALYLPYILIFAYTLLAIFGAVATPAWFSLLGDIVPSDYRGRYFSKRNRICETVSLLSFLGASFLLDYFKTKGFILLGFGILFLFAGVFRMISAGYFTKHYEPLLKIKKQDFFSFKTFIKNLRNTNFGRFTFFTTVFYLSIAIAGPFFTVYMLKNLGFSYITFMIVSLAGSVFSLLSLAFWGKFSDRYGNRKLMILGASFVSIMPFFWLFSKSPVYLALVPQFFSGIGWAAFSLSISNYIYDVNTPEKRALSLSYFNILVGFGSFFGALIGGYIAQYVTSIFTEGLFLLFILSGTLRAAASFMFLPQIEETRKVKKEKVPALQLLTYRLHLPEFLHHQVALIRNLENDLVNRVIRVTPSFLYKRTK